MVPTGLPWSTRLSRASMAHRAPFLVGKRWYAFRHTSTTWFSEMTSLVRNPLAASLARSSRSLTSAAWTSSSAAFS